jgi:TolA-binding protein
MPGTPGPEQPNCSIVGRLLFTHGEQPIQSVMIKLFHSGVPRDQTFTDSAGNFRFQYLTRGVYEVVVERDGYRTARTSADLTFVCVNYNVTVMMEPETVVRVEKTTEPTVSSRVLQIPDKARKEFQKGVKELEEKGKPEKSLPHFQRALEIYPDYDEAYVQLAVAHLQMNQPAEAQQALEQGIAVYDANARAYVLLGMILGKQGKLEKSIEALRAGVQADDNDWLGHFELGRALLKKRQGTEARLHAERAHELNPGNRGVHLLLHDVCMLQNDLKAALAEVDEYLRLFPDDELAPRLRQHGDDLRKSLAASIQ